MINKDNKIQNFFWLNTLFNSFYLSRKKSCFKQWFQQYAMKYSLTPRKGNLMFRFIKIDKSFCVKNWIIKFLHDLKSKILCFFAMSNGFNHHLYKKQNQETTYKYIFFHVISSPLLKFKKKNFMDTFLHPQFRKW